MTKNLEGYGTSTIPKGRYLVSKNSSYIGTPDELVVIFERIFNSSDKMRDLNKLILLFINQKITEGDTKIVLRLLQDDAVLDFHPSLLKSILLITESINHLEGVSIQRNRIETRMEEQL